MSPDAVEANRTSDALAATLKRTEIQRGPSSIPGREIVQVLTEIPAGVESGWHTHPGEEVGYILAGTVEMRDPRTSRRSSCNAGDGFLMPPRMPHNALDLGPDTGLMLSTYIVEIRRAARDVHLRRKWSPAPRSRLSDGTRRLGQRRAAAPVQVNGHTVLTAIWKHPVAGRVPLRGVNLHGDDQADRTVHGGPDKAVYAYAREDTDWWEDRNSGVPLGVAPSARTSPSADYRYRRP